MICKIVTRFACAAAFLVSPWFTGDSHSQVLTMREALTRALAASPRLTAAERDVGVATGQRIQAGALLNPEVSYEQDNSFGSGRFQGTKSAETTLQISQAFEWFGKREARIAGGEAGVETAAIQRQAVRLEVLSETAIAFANVLGAKRRIQILDEQVAAIDRLTPLLQRRVEAGASSPAETGRAEVASALVKADRERLRSTLASARRELAVLMGDPAPKIRLRLRPVRADGPAALVSVRRGSDRRESAIGALDRRLCAAEGRERSQPTERAVVLRCMAFSRSVDTKVEKVVSSARIRLSSHFEFSAATGDHSSSTPVC
jgi:outer membrane protein TolC